MAKAHIKTKTGCFITIEGDAAEVARIVMQVGNGSHPADVKQLTPEQKEKRQARKAATATNLVVELKEEGFFDKPKSLAEVGIEIEKSGYLYPLTTLSGVMLGLVQKRMLTRMKKDKRWVYGKR